MSFIYSRVVLAEYMAWKAAQKQSAIHPDTSTVLCVPTISLRLI
jgi:hypothetical protein